MFETQAEIAALQALLDRSMVQAGPHLRSIFEGARMSASDLVGKMTGMQLLTVATLSRDGRPLAGAVDGYLLHGELRFSSGPEAVRTRQLRRNPAVSATWLPDESAQLTVHGEVEIVPFCDPRTAELRQAMLDHYVPRAGPEWARFPDEPERDGAVAFRVLARRAFGYFRHPGAP
jgi:hypothetical protein